MTTKIVTRTAWLRNILLTGVGLLASGCMMSDPNLVRTQTWIAPPPTPPSQWAWSQAHPLPAHEALVQVAARPAGIEVPIQRNRSGLYEVPVTIGDIGSYVFEIDSGASTVTMPANGYLQLLDAGMIVQSDDYLGRTASVLADGSVVGSLTFNLTSMTIGGRTVTNVRCDVVADGGSYLLGQSFLSKFRAWSIDNNRGVLVLE